MESIRGFDSRPRLVNLEIAGYGSVAFEDMKAAAAANSF